MPAFLLDTSILVTLLREKSTGNTDAWNHLRALPADSRVAISAITLAEIDVGCCLAQQDMHEARSEITELIANCGFHVEHLTQHAVPYYGEIKANLWRKYQPKKLRWPERWKDKATGADLGVEEPDLLIVAQALQLGYVFVTCDAMGRIRAALQETTSLLDFQDWTKPPTT